MSHIPALVPARPTSYCIGKKTSLVPPMTAAELEPTSSVEAVGPAALRREADRVRRGPEKPPGPRVFGQSTGGEDEGGHPCAAGRGLPLRAPPPTRRTCAVARRAPAPPSEDGAVPWPPAEGAWEARREEGPRGADIPMADVGGDGGAGAPSTRRTLGRAVASVEALSSDSLRWPLSREAPILTATTPPPDQVPRRPPWPLPRHVLSRP
jgi:hypothetical protein